ERRKVRRLATGDESVIDNDLLIDPFRPGIFQVDLDALVRRDATSFDDASVNECPRTVANGGDRFSMAEKITNEFYRVRLCAQLVWIHHAAGQNERVVLVWIGVGKDAIHFKLIAP